MSGQHTEGPWRANEYREVLDHDGRTICRAHLDSANKPIEMVEANARLIAAAPTMRDYVAKRAAAGDAEALQILEAIDGNA